MNLADLDASAPFALLGPGFADGGFLLLENLAPSSRGNLVFAPYERRGREATRLHGVSRRLQPPVFPGDLPDLAPALEADDHERCVERIRQAIAAGDVYQVCLTRPARLPPVSGSLLFAAMCAGGAARFAAWVRLPDGTEFVSASPELFFEIRDGCVRSEPMKGTARPGAGGELALSGKDAAELAMITDLVRNDLTPVCEPGTISVACARRFVELPYAVQTVADVEGRLRGRVGPLGVLDALHPGGSVTGAPKHAALRMIRTLERRPRGAYCGALAYGGGRVWTCSLLIRTAQRDAAGWTYGVGGGIVFDSEPAREMDELHVKLGALRCAGRR